MSASASTGEGRAPFAWRALRVEDLSGLGALADLVHPTFFERPEVMAERLALFPAGCLALPGPHARLSGYVLSHPARLGAPPPLDTLIGRLAADADALYLHDIALGPECRGRGLATEAVERILSLGAAFGAVMLVSVYGTAPFWHRFGFHDRTEAIAAQKLVPYGAGARYMVRRGDTSRQGGRDCVVEPSARGLGSACRMLNSEAITAARSLARSPLFPMRPCRNRCSRRSISR